MQTVSATLAQGSRLLAGSSPSPRADAQILLAHTLGRDREWLVAYGESIVTKAHADRFTAFCEKRAAGMPVPYITGFAGFYKREFAVNEHVLIPRPESEHLVEDAVAFLQDRIKADPHAKLFTVFEAGVGSGAIACTIAAEIPGAIVEGTDTSTRALEVARHNAQRLNVQTRCKFFHADIVQNGSERNYDLVIANLPYVPTADIPQKPDPVGYEPREALDGGPDGLNVYRRLLLAAPRLLRPGALLLMEAAPPTLGALHELTELALPGSLAEIRRDYAGQERYVYVKAVKTR